MRRVLRWLEAAATHRPATTLAGLAVMTLALAALATTLELQVDLTQFGREDSEAVQAMQRVRADFGDPTASVQVILDAGRDGDVLTGAGLAAVAAAEDVVISALGPDLRRGPDARPHVLSLTTAVDAALAGQDLDPATLDDAQVGAVVGRAAAANPQLATLLSDDLDLHGGSARATVLVALLDPDLSEAARTEASKRLRTAFGGDRRSALGDVQVTVFSSGLFVAGLLDAVRAEAPPLFGLALLVVLAILAVAYRSVFDVAVGLVGLLATVVCTFGFIALLGPGYLGWTGPPSQLAVVVPVLLVGLGIDYSVHLTARYREQRAAGEQPAAAAGRALHTVGAALVLATAATATGFATTATAPVRMIADFGVFVAVGVVCAFTIMALLVPAARVLRDRRAPGGGPRAVRELGLEGLTRAPIGLARRAPAAGLLVAMLLTGASLLAATRLETEFDRDNFIPEGSEVEAVLAYQEELFGSGVTESTYVVLDGDFTDPGLTDALREAQDRLDDVDGVRTLGRRPQLRSVLSLLAALGPEATQATDLAPVYDRLRQAVGEAQVAQVLTPDARSGLVQIRTTTGDAGAEDLRRAVKAAFSPVEHAGGTVTVTSEPIIIAEMSQDLSRFQARAVGLTLAIVLALLTAYYARVHRRWLLGMIALLPATVSASLIVGTMWLLGVSFNAVTATLTAIAVGIGVPYGVHVVNRFAENLAGAPVADAVAMTLRSTGGALTGSALTTLGAFVVLAFSNLPPIRSLGLLGGVGIAFALLAAVLVEPGALVLSARRSRTRDDAAHHPDA